MNLSSILGIAAALLVLLVSVFTSTSNSKIFLDPHGILIVIGGTAAAGMLCFPIKTYLRVLTVLKNKILWNYALRYDTVINELVDLAKGMRDNAEYARNKAKSVNTPFLKDALELMNLGGISEESLDEILLKRAETYSKRYDHDAVVIKALSKFPPAFGLMGTTLGMISLLQQLGGKDAQKFLGVSMALGLVATFYGIVLANLVFIPIAENLTAVNKEDETVRAIVIDGLRLIRKKEHPKMVEEYLKSYLLPHERSSLKAGAAAAKA